MARASLPDQTAAAQGSTSSTSHSSRTPAASAAKAASETQKNSSEAVLLQYIEQRRPLIRIRITIAGATKHLSIYINCDPTGFNSPVEDFQSI